MKDHLFSTRKAGTHRGYIALNTTALSPREYEAPLRAWAHPRRCSRCGRTWNSRSHSLLICPNCQHGYDRPNLVAIS